MTHRIKLYLPKFLINSFKTPTRPFPLRSPAAAGSSQPCNLVLSVSPAYQALPSKATLLSKYLREFLVKAPALQNSKPVKSGQRRNLA